MEQISFFTGISALNSSLVEIVHDHNDVFVLCDENTKEHCLPLLQRSLSDTNVIAIRSGEAAKNLHTCEYIWERLTAHTADRKALLINLGGGVITDMGGFAASCYKRGIDYVNIPTTLLAMVDASVGGKTAIDFNDLKNQIGLFSKAKAVLICPEFLDTLDSRQLMSGLAEVVKHYLIADEDAFMSFNGLNHGKADIELIRKAIAIKSHIVDQDPYEKDLRKVLNFGHTIGHALEGYSLATDEPLLHGEAVAIGMAIEAFISERIGLLSAPHTEFIFDRLDAIFDLRPLPEEMADGIMPLIMQDKKNENGIVKMSLLEGIGKCKTNIEVDIGEISAEILLYNGRLAG